MKMKEFGPPGGARVPGAPLGNFLKKIKLPHNTSLVYKSDADPTVLSRHVLNRSSLK